MTEPPLVVFAVPDRFEIDGSFIARALEERDIPTVAPAFRDPGIGGENGMPPFDEEELRTVLRERIPELRARGVLFPYVIEDTTDGSICGGVTLRHFDPMRGVIEVGYWLFADARGRGLATRAVRAEAREAFASGLWRIEAHVRIGNDASERVLERAGFTREGIKRRLLRHGGERVDATGFSLLADE
jgi:RimJ/RimL family protein N-acetyltransferase